MKRFHHSKYSGRAFAGYTVAALLGVAIASLNVHAQPVAQGSPPGHPTFVNSDSADAGGVSAVARIGITVSDLDRAVAFYTNVLTFRRVDEVERVGPELEHLTGVFGARVRSARLRLGSEIIELTEFIAPEGRPMPVESRSNDRWFQHIAIVVSDMDKAYAHLRAHKVRHASSGPQTLPSWNPNAGGISAFYFKDPDGHVLEVIHFPPGKGDPRWQSPIAELFQGIDHTAIVVEDTDRSLAFYRDTLGLTVSGSSENYGTEQEHLNNVFGARLRITALRAAAGPGVELLEYLSPTDGRLYPRDARANDLLHWHTTFITTNASATSARLRSVHASWISPGFVSGPGLPDDALAAARVQDPDGHVIETVQPRP